MWAAIKEFFTKLPEILSTIAGNQYGLILLILIIIATLAIVLLFRTPSRYRLTAFIMMLLCGGTLVYQLLTPLPHPFKREQENRVPKSVSSEKAQAFLEKAERENKLGNNREARDDYSQARTLYQQENHRLGEANASR